MGNTRTLFGRSKVTAEEVVGDRDLSEMHFFVTGCNTGIGKETVRVLYNQGAHITMACRNIDRMTAAKDEIESQPDEAVRRRGHLYTIMLDLSSQDDVKRCTTEYLAQFEAGSAAESAEAVPNPIPPKREIDVLILNAGVMGIPARQITDDGFELQMAVNHFGHHSLTMLLLPYVVSRVVSVSSYAHLRYDPCFDLTDLNWETRRYHNMKAYGQSKAANILWARELNKRLAAAGKNVLAFSLHPGMIATELARQTVKNRAIYAFATPLLKSIPQGASTSVYVALSPDLNEHGGAYLADCEVCSIMTTAAKSEENAVGLFELTMRETGLSLPFRIGEGEDVAAGAEEEEGEIATG